MIVIYQSINNFIEKNNQRLGSTHHAPSIVISTFKYINSFNPHNGPMNCVLLFPPILQVRKHGKGHTVNNGTSSQTTQHPDSQELILTGSSYNLDSRKL